MQTALQAAGVVGAWALVVLTLVIGLWFLRRHQLLHHAVIVVLILVGIFVLIRLRELVLMLLLAGVVAFVLDRPVDWLAKRMPRPLAITLVYLVLVGGFVLAGTLVIPQIGRQAQAFSQDLPRYQQQWKDYVVRWSTWYGGVPEQVQSAIDTTVEHVKGSLGAVTGQVEHFLLEVVAWIVKTLLILVISIYLLTDRDLLRGNALRLFPADMRGEAGEALNELQETFSRYLRGQAIVVLFVAAAVTLVLTLLGIRYAVFIGVMAGVLEIIPYFGPIAGAVPAVTIAFATKPPWVGVVLIIFFIAINQIEGHVVIPLVMGHHLEMRPLTIIVALIAGEMLFGIVGMIIAVPAVSLVRVLIPYVAKQYHHFRMREHTRVATTGPGPPPEPIVATEKM